MKLIVNTSNLQTGGALQVALSLLAEWNTDPADREFHVFLSPQLSKLIYKESFGPSFSFYEFSQNPASNLYTAFTFSKKLQQLEKRIRPHAVLTIFGPALWTPKAPHLAGFANGYYLFDRSDFIRKKILNNLLSRIAYYIRRTILFYQLRKEATAYWVETDAAKGALARILKKGKSCISVIGNTYSGSFRNKSAIAAEQAERFTFLYLSAYYAHKNFEIFPGLINILAAGNIECTFVFTLPEDTFAILFEKVPHREYLRNLGPVNPQESYNLYAQCHAVIMPSLLETFSANFPEAMMAEKPILTSDRSFAKNICGDAALYFDPEDAASVADRVAMLIADLSLQQTLVQKGKERLHTMETPTSRAVKIMGLLEDLSKDPDS